MIGAHQAGVNLGFEREAVVLAVFQSPWARDVRNGEWQPAHDRTINAVERWPTPAARAYRVLATLLKVLLRLVPRDVIAAMAAIATSAAISPYSIAVTPRLSSVRRRTILQPLPSTKPCKNDTQAVIIFSEI